jgi:glycosyltransferase involved in cell wall biosynthesis
VIVACIPAYNEEDTIARIVLLTKKYVDRVVVCDDGSSDLTGEIAQELGASLIKHEARKGYGAAIGDLFTEAQKLGAEIIVSLDADGQHDPTEIPKLIEPIVNGEAEVVIGSRFLEEENNHVPRLRRLGIDAITRLTSAASGIPLGDAQSGFRAYSIDTLKRLELRESGMGISAEILLQFADENLRIVEVPISCRYEGIKTSTQHPITHGAGVVMSIVRSIVEEKPLMYLGVPGLIFLIIGTFFGFRLLQLYVLDRRIITNIALASISFILLGFFTIFTAITLYAVSRMRKQMK